MLIWGDMLEPACTRVVYTGKYFTISCVQKAYPASFMVPSTPVLTASESEHATDLPGAWYDVRTTQTRVSCKINENVQASVVCIEPI